MPILAYWHIFLIVQWAKFRKLKPITSLCSVPLDVEYTLRGGLVFAEETKKTAEPRVSGPPL